MENARNSVLAGWWTSPYFVQKARIRLPYPLPRYSILLSRMGKALLFWVAVFIFGAISPAHAQQLAKYGADFLSGGVGGRALGMGGTGIALSQEVSAGYWNPAALNALEYPEVGYLHVERFGGVVTFDYLGLAFPLNERSTFAISLFRSGVNDIKNTLNAWDPERNQPKVRYQDFVTSFSAADYALYLSFARSLRDGVDVGGSAKVIRRTIGPFAEAWGYSMDLSARWQRGPFALGATLQDAPGQYQMWTVDPQAFQVNQQVNPQTGQPYTFEETFGQDLPEGGTFAVLPVLRLGSAYTFTPGAHRLTVAADADLTFDHQRAYVVHAGPVSIQPRFGAEFDFRQVIAFRAGVSRFTVLPEGGVSVTPTLGAGLRLAQLHLDYGFGDFAGITADLGFTHRISARLTLEQPRFARSRP